VLQDTKEQWLKHAVNHHQSRGDAKIYTAEGFSGTQTPQSLPPAQPPLQPQRPGTISKVFAFQTFTSEITEIH